MTTTVTTTVYVTDTCTQCPTLLKQLDKRGLEPHTVNVGEHTAALKLVTGDLGVSSVPVTVIDGLFDHPVVFNGLAFDQLINIKKTMTDVGAVTHDSAEIDAETGLPEDVPLNRLHWLEINGELTPVLSVA